MTEAKQLMAFIKKIEANPRDVNLRGVYADWLEEHGFDDEAAIQRAWTLKKHDAKECVRQFCARYGADYDGLLHGMASGEGYCFGDDDGPYEIRENHELWEAVELLVGHHLDEEHRESTPFRCAC